MKQVTRSGASLPSDSPCQGCASLRPAAVVVDAGALLQADHELFLSHLQRECEAAAVPPILLVEALPHGPRVVSATSGPSPLLRELGRALLPGRSPGGVLLVEDDADLAQVLCDMFEADGVPVRHAGSGQQAIAMAQACSPELMILDVSLPQGDGFSVVHWLRQSNDLRNLPLIVYSARDLTQDDKRNLGLGRTEFFTKSRTMPDEFERQAVTLLREITGQEKAARAR